MLLEHLRLQSCSRQDQKAKEFNLRNAPLSAFLQAMWMWLCCCCIWYRISWMASFFLKPIYRAKRVFLLPLSFSFPSRTFSRWCTFSNSSTAETFTLTQHWMIHDETLFSQFATVSKKLQRTSWDIYIDFCFCFDLAVCISLDRQTAIFYQTYIYFLQTYKKFLIKILVWNKLSLRLQFATITGHSREFILLNVSLSLRLH